MGSKWKANERQAEIMRILESRRQETVASFAFHFDVSIRTICCDMDCLVAQYSIKTMLSNAKQETVGGDCGMTSCSRFQA